MLSNLFHVLPHTVARLRQTLVPVTTHVTKVELAAFADLAQMVIHKVSLTVGASGNLVYNVMLKFSLSISFW